METGYSSEMCRNLQDCNQNSQHRENLKTRVKVFY
jgi:hypothetical protein